MTNNMVSIIVPIYNEEDNVAELHRQIVQSCQTLGKPYEIIFIDDGSSDRSLERMQQLTPLRIVEFRKNFGQTAAIDAGFKAAKGDVFITLDGDLQNDPADIPLLLQKMEEGYDVVSGWRKKRKDKPMKKIFSRVAHVLRTILISDGIHDSGCTLKAYSRVCFATNNDLYGEMHRFVPALLKIQGFRIGEVIVNHRSRIHGVTKYNWQRGVKGFLDMWAIWFWKKYSNRSLHLFGTIGLIMMFVSFLSGSYALYLKLFHGADLSNTALTDLSMFGFFIGVQFMVFGVISDILIKTYYKSAKTHPYSIREVIENV